MQLQALVLLTRLFPSVPNSIVTHSYCGTHIEEPILAKLLKKGCGSCKQFQQTHGTDTIQPHKETASSCFEGLLYEAERRSQILVCTVCILSGNGFFHVLVGRDVCVRKTIVCSATQFLRVVQFCKGLIYIKNSNNRDQEWL